MMQGFEYRTPESLTLTQPVAGIGSRGLAAVVDSCIVLIIMLALVVGALALSIVSASAQAAGPTLIVVVVLASVVPLIYYVTCEVATSGRSVGKLIFGLRVVDLQGVPLGTGDSLVRNLIRILDFLPFGYLIGVVAMFAGSQPRRLGDLAAGTVVVHDRGMKRLAADLGPAVRAVATLSTDIGQPLPGLNRCGKFELDMVQDFLSRPGLTPDRRISVAARLVAAISTRAGPGFAVEAEGRDPVAVLEQTYQQLSQRLSGT
jgi:uncharacterized RDD family membrane protein YckC